MSNTIRWMVRRDLPEVITLAQIDPKLRAMGRDVEPYLLSIAKSTEGRCVVYDEEGIVEGLAVCRLNSTRVTVLHLAGTSRQIVQKLIGYGLGKLSNKRRFLDLELELSLFNAPVIRWAGEKRGLIRSDGVDRNSVTVTFSRPRRAETPLTRTV